MRYEDKDGNLLGYPAAPDLKTDSDWVTLSAESDIPAGTDHVDVDAGNYGTAGEVAFDDIVVAPIAGDAVTPAAETARGKQRRDPSAGRTRYLGQGAGRNAFPASRADRAQRPLEIPAGRGGREQAGRRRLGLHPRARQLAHRL
jgi:hypothetical protein